jgi:alkylation response protein AidB-like acyl-CoA dehydrogenase
MLAPESSQGWRGTVIELTLCLEELGRVAAPGPVLEHSAVAVPMLGDSPWASDLAAGTLVATAALGDPVQVAHAGVADLALIPSGVLLLADASLIDCGGMDGGRRVFQVHGGTLVEHPFDVDGAFDRGALAAAAVLLGVSDRLIGLSVEYARERHQFGHPIGSYQAVRHLLADALLRLEFARPVVYRAAWSLGTGEPTSRRDVSMAKLFADEAAHRAARVALQVHGAVGYTWEADLHLWMKKAWALRQTWGTPAFHRRRVDLAVTPSARRAAK